MCNDVSFGKQLIKTIRNRHRHTIILGIDRAPTTYMKAIGCVVAAAAAVASGATAPLLMKEENFPLMV